MNKNVKIIRWTGHNLAEVAQFVNWKRVTAAIRQGNDFAVRTTVGVRVVRVGDYIVFTPTGEVYPLSSKYYQMDV